MKKIITEKEIFEILKAFNAPKYMPAAGGIKAHYIYLLLINKVTGEVVPAGPERSIYTPYECITSELDAKAYKPYSEKQSDPLFWQKYVEAEGNPYFMDVVKDLTQQVNDYFAREEAFERKIEREAVRRKLIHDREDILCVLFRKKFLLEAVKASEEVIKNFKEVNIYNDENGSWDTKLPHEPRYKKVFFYDDASIEVAHASTKAGVIKIISAFDFYQMLDEARLVEHSGSGLPYFRSIRLIKKFPYEEIYGKGHFGGYFSFEYNDFYDVCWGLWYANTTEEYSIKAIENMDIKKAKKILKELGE